MIDKNTFELIKKECKRKNCRDCLFCDKISGAHATCLFGNCIRNTCHYICKVDLKDINKYEYNNKKVNKRIVKLKLKNL